MGTSRNRFFLILVNILLAFNVLAVISILFSYGAQYINPRDAWIFALFGLLYPYLLILNIFFVFLWLFLRKRYALISLIAILAGWKQLNTMVTLPANNPILLPGQNISLTTWNVHGFAGQMNVRGNVRSEIIEYLSEKNPDLLCMQEVRIYEADVPPVFQRMSRAWGLPYHYEKDYYSPDQNNGFNGIVTFSRFPIIRSGSLDEQPKKCFGIYTDILLGNDTLRILNIHLASLRLRQSDVDFYYHLKKTETENIRIRAGIFSILRKLKLAFFQRADETANLLKAIKQSPYPVLVCGDMNDTPFSYTYKQLTSSLTDAYREAGEGFFGSTYDGALPNYRIDYILFDKHFKAFSYEKSDVTFSDHYPVSGLIMLAH
ncbi:MAG: endonuclease/exonuclease/phosphatase family protein [Bacteroidales bacterium]|nr:endonuclease/exonuclease/phosphatase family protein [Bacteroidales bacterium]